MGVEGRSLIPTNPNSTPKIHTKNGKKSTIPLKHGRAPTWTETETEGRKDLKNTKHTHEHKQYSPIILVGPMHTSLQGQPCVPYARMYAYICAWACICALGLCICAWYKGPRPKA